MEILINRLINNNCVPHQNFIDEVSEHSYNEVCDTFILI